jgi:hypothetical protein
MVSKVCTVCKISQSSDCFYKTKNGSAIKSVCIICQKQIDKVKHKLKYKPKIKNNICKIAQCGHLKSDGALCVDHRKEYNRERAFRHRTKNPYAKKTLKKCKTDYCEAFVGHSTIYGLCKACYISKNAHADNLRAKEYYQRNKDRVRESKKVRYRNDPEYRISVVLRARLSRALKNNQKKGSAVRDLGCSIDNFKTYLESKFQPGMSWMNWGRGQNKWHIDHIVPLCCFDLSDLDQLKKACHYTNLQPLWETQNLRKGGKHGS